MLIPAVVVGWLARGDRLVMDTLADHATGIPAHAGVIGVGAGFAIAVRVLLEQLADAWYPERLRYTSVPDDLPEPTLSAEIAGIVVRAVAFAFLGHVFIGTCPQWYAGVALFVLPDVLGQVRYRTGFTLPSSLPLPTGLTQILLAVIGSTILVAAAIAKTTGHLDDLRAAFVVAGLVPGVLGSLQAFRDEEAPRPATSWELQVAGLGILATCLILAVHGYSY